MENTTHPKPGSTHRQEELQWTAIQLFSEPLTRRGPLAVKYLAGYVAAPQHAKVRSFLGGNSHEKVEAFLCKHPNIFNFKNGVVYLVGKVRSAKEAKSETNSEAGVAEAKDFLSGVLLNKGPLPLSNLVGHVGSSTAAIRQTAGASVEKLSVFCKRHTDMFRVSSASLLQDSIVSPKHITGPGKPPIPLPWPGKPPIPLPWPGKPPIPLPWPMAKSGDSDTERDSDRHDCQASAAPLETGPTPPQNLAGPATQQTWRESLVQLSVTECVGQFETGPISGKLSPSTSMSASAGKHSLIFSADLPGHRKEAVEFLQSVLLKRGPLALRLLVACLGELTAEIRQAAGSNAEGLYVFCKKNANVFNISPAESVRESVVSLKASSQAPSSSAGANKSEPPPSTIAELQADTAEAREFLQAVLLEQGPLPVKNLVGYLSTLSPATRQAAGANIEGLYMFCHKNSDIFQICSTGSVREATVALRQSAQRPPRPAESTKSKASSSPVKGKSVADAVTHNNETYKAREFLRGVLLETAPIKLKNLVGYVGNSSAAIRQTAGAKVDDLRAFCVAHSDLFTVSSAETVSDSVVSLKKQAANTALPVKTADSGNSATVHRSTKDQTLTNATCQVHLIMSNQAFATLPSGDEVYLHRNVFKEEDCKHLLEVLDIGDDVMVDAIENDMTDKSRFTRWRAVKAVIPQWETDGSDTASNPDSTSSGDEAAPDQDDAVQTVTDVTCRVHHVTPWNAFATLPSGEQVFIHRKFFLQPQSQDLQDYLEAGDALIVDAAKNQADETRPQFTEWRALKVVMPDGGLQTPSALPHHDNDCPDVPPESRDRPITWLAQGQTAAFSEDRLHLGLVIDVSTELKLAIVVMETGAVNILPLGQPDQLGEATAENEVETGTAIELVHRTDDNNVMARWAVTKWRPGAKDTRCAITKANEGNYVIAKVLAITSANRLLLETLDGAIVPVQINSLANGEFGCSDVDHHVVPGDVIRCKTDVALTEDCELSDVDILSSYISFCSLHEKGLLTGQTDISHCIVDLPTSLAIAHKESPKCSTTDIAHGRGIVAAAWDQNLVINFGSRLSAFAVDQSRVLFPLRDGRVAVVVCFSAVREEHGREPWQAVEVWQPGLSAAEVTSSGTTVSGRRKDVGVQTNVTGHVIGCTRYSGD